MKLTDLARSSGDSKSPMSALWTLWSRFRSLETSGKTGETAGDTGETSKVSRRSYESVPDRLPLCACLHCCSKKPWSLFLAFFILLVILASSIDFLFGRIIEIKVFIRVRATDLLPAYPDS